MKKKLFVVSDIHGHATILKETLANAGFDENNEDHLFVCCGDCFDRGTENREVYNFVKGLKNKIIIRGNHEDILKTVISAGFIDYVNVYNGTDVTIEEFFGVDSISSTGQIDIDVAVRDQLIDFIEDTYDYFETENYVFVHGWIPLCLYNSPPTVNPSWRSAERYDWGRARFTGWTDTYDKDVTLKDKTIVCGHRPTRLAVKADPQRSPTQSDIYYGNGFIAIDAGTIRSRRMNLLVIEDELLPSQRHSMKLLHEPFEAIASQTKTVEMRLFDEKRQKIRPGDIIEFLSEESGDTLKTRVLGIYAYADFESLVASFSSKDLGSPEADADEICEFMKKIYKKEDIERNGTVAIKIKLINE